MTSTRALLLLLPLGLVAIVVACGNSTDTSTSDIPPGSVSLDAGDDDASACSGAAGDAVETCATSVCPAGATMADAVVYLCQAHVPSVTIGCNVLSSNDSYATRFAFDDDGNLVAILGVPDNGDPDTCIGETGQSCGYGCTDVTTLSYDLFCLADGAVNPDDGG